jgi:hypothetical protein
LQGAPVIPDAHGASGSPGTDWKVVGSGDYNGDGKSDILLHNTSGALRAYLMDGTTISGNGGVTWAATEWGR